MPTINTQDISVIIQGAVDFSIIDQVLSSVKTILPAAQVILSTWEGVDYSNIDNRLYDVLVTSPDPGGFKPFPNASGSSAYLKNYLNNIDRQIVSSSNGIMRATQSYCLKMRTDMVLTHSRFLTYFERYNHYQTEYKLVKSRILNNASGAIDPLLNHPLHPADFFLFGYTEDIKAFFSAPLFPDIDKLYQHNETDILAKILLKRDGQLFGNKCYPEIYLMTCFIQLYNPAFKGFGNYEISAESVKESYRYMLNNFVFLSDKQLGFRNLKHPHFERLHYSRGFHNIKWQLLYKLFCDANHIIENEESDNVEPFAWNVLNKLTTYNTISLNALIRLKFAILLANLQKKWHKRTCKWYKKPYPTGYQVHDLTMLRTLYSVVKALHQDQQLLYNLQTYLTLNSKIKHCPK